MHLNWVYSWRVIYKEHKHYKLIKMESKYKINQDQAEKLGFV